MTSHYLTANWPAPSNVATFCTTRHLGNLAYQTHSADDIVTANRQQLQSTLSLPSEPHWLNQVHGTHVIQLPSLETSADASYSNQPNHVCSVLTADCLPILLCDHHGQEVAAVHAGWRGLLNGVIENTLASFSTTTGLAWLGPAISQLHFAVGDEIYHAFIEKNSDYKIGFKRYPDGQWHADLYCIARLILEKAGFTVYGGEYCSYRDEALFYSYRRDQGNTGRMASLIWFHQ